MVQCKLSEHVLVPLRLSLLGAGVRLKQSLRKQVSVLATEVLQLSLVVFLQQVLLVILDPQMLKLLRYRLLSYFPEQAEDHSGHVLHSNVFV